MTAEELKQHLIQDFDLVIFRDIADAWHQHRAIFDIFKSVSRAVFEPNQRLVFYTAHDPEPAFLDHIQRAAARIDISNFFILIVCPFDITDKLRESNRQHGYDDVIIGSMRLPLAETRAFGAKGWYNLQTMCALPFSSISLGPAGHARPCCKFQTTTGRVGAQGITEVFYNSSMQRLREEMLEGRRPEGCQVCWQSEDTGTQSLRQLAMIKYGDQLDQQWLDDVQLRDFTWSPMSLCNFSCRICCPENSTAIAVERIRFSDDLDEKQRLQVTIKQHNDMKFANEIAQSIGALTHLKNLHILGGEPFLWPNLDAALDLLIQTGQSKNITLEFNTNGSVFPTQRIEKIIDNFHFLEILISLDNVGQRFEIERGGRWNEILINLKKFSKLQNSNVRIKFAVTVNVQNLLYLDDILLFAQHLGIEIVWSYLEEPTMMCIDYATEQTKRLVHELYHNHSEPELRNIAKRVAISLGSDGRDFLAYCQKIDSQRGQNFALSHAEIFESMGGRSSLSDVLTSHTS